MPCVATISFDFNQSEGSVFSREVKARLLRRPRWTLNGSTFFFFTSALINKLDTDIKETIESFDINRSRTVIIDNIHWILRQVS